MFKALRLSDSGVQAARRHEAIIGKPVMARGSFSAVFDNDKTVHKLTLDRYAYMLGCDRVIGCSGRHFTEVLHNYGEVGEVDGHPLYLFECEKLEKLPNAGDVRKLARNVAKRATAHKTYHLRCMDWSGGDADFLALDELSQDESLPESMQLAFEELHSFTHRVEKGWALDIHAANLMVRPADGGLVLSDPLADMATRNALDARRYITALN